MPARPLRYGRWFLQRSPLSWVLRSTPRVDAAQRYSSGRTPYSYDAAADYPPARGIEPAASRSPDVPRGVCWPLITNATELSPAEVVAAYKCQPNLERPHAQLKGPQAVAPVLLRDPARIEALLCCHFLALLVEALIERQIRQAMATSKTTTIPLYPEDRDCAAPSAARVLEIFAGVSRHRLIHQGSVVQVFEPTLTPVQEQVLKLLGVPVTAYRLG